MTTRAAHLITEGRLKIGTSEDLSEWQFDLLMNTVAPDLAASLDLAMDETRDRILAEWKSRIPGLVVEVETD